MVTAYKCRQILDYMYMYVCWHCCRKKTLPKRQRIPQTAENALQKSEDSTEGPCDWYRNPTWYKVTPDSTTLNFLLVNCNCIVPELFSAYVPCIFQFVSLLCCSLTLEHGPHKTDGCTCSYISIIIIIAKLHGNFFLSVKQSTAQRLVRLQMAQVDT